MNGKTISHGIIQRALALCLTAALLWSGPARPAALARAALAEGAGGGRKTVASGTRYQVSFDYLNSLNQDVKGWLYQPGTEINYPVVRGVDNQYYRKRTFEKSQGLLGSVYMDYENAAGFTDPATYLYGRNTTEDGLLKSLNGYREQAYYQAHPNMVLLTPQGDFQVELFAAMETTMNDNASWRMEANATEQAFMLFVNRLIEQSIFTAPEASRPEWGDQLLALVTWSNYARGPRLVIFGRMRPIVYQAEKTLILTKLDMDRRATANGYVTIDGVGTFMTYAQNDPLWADVRYEARNSEKKRKFGAGGCGPTAVAMALVNLLPKKELPLIFDYAGSELGYTFCSCSVNSSNCTHRHAQYQVQTTDELFRYMPLVLGDFATGNNLWGVQSRGEGQGSSMRFLDYLCQLYGIDVTTTRVAREAVDMLMEGGGRRVVISCATWGSPFTTGGHYVVMAAADQEYVYILDPMRHNDYSAMDRRGYVEVLAPGVVRIRQENITDCNLSPHYVLEKH